MSHRRAVAYTLPMLALGTIFGLSIASPRTNWHFKNWQMKDFSPEEANLDFENEPAVASNSNTTARFVSEQMTRTARYEDRLKRKLQALDAILEDVEKLDTGAIDAEPREDRKSVV